MPDIKSALQHALARAATPSPSISKVLDDWSSDDAPQRPATQPQQATTMTLTATPAPRSALSGSSISAKTFNFIRDNPYLPMSEVVDGLSAHGLNPNSTGSLIYQMVRNGMVSRDKDNRVTALQRAYTPVQAVKLNRRSTRKSQPRATPDTAPTPVTLDLRASTRGLAALGTPNAFNATVAPPSPTVLTAKQVLETLSVKEARALYLELKEMFGG